MASEAVWPDATRLVLSPRQAQVARRLSQQIGRGPEVFFRDACGLLAERPLRPSVTHLVGHLLREVESAVRAVLEPTDSGANVKGNKHRAKVEAVLADLEIPLDDPVAETWLGLTGEDNPDGLARRAHRSALDAPRPPDQAFLDLISRVEFVLDAVLERFEARYFEVFERLDQLLAIAEPTRQNAKAIRNNFPNSYAVSAYFFSRATAAWLGPLKAEGFFQTPPPPQPDEDNGTVQLPSWPESQFLVRVAPHASEDVVDVAAAIPSSDNPRINHDLIKVALASPPELAVRLVPKIVHAVGSRFGVLIPHEAGALLVVLSEGQRVDEAMALAQALIDRAPTNYGPTSSVDAYEYGTILRKHIPSLVPVAGVRALVMLDEALVKVIRSDSERHGAVPRNDSSLIWRPNIENGGSRAEAEIRHLLVDAARDAAVSLVSMQPDSVEEVVAELESHDLPIFHRIALWLLAKHGGQARELTTAHLLDQALIGDRYIEREYLLLAHACAGTLEAADLRRLLRLVDAGPTADALGMADEDVMAEAAMHDLEAREEVALWQRDRLAALQSVLPPAWDARYQALVTEYGQAPDPTETLPERFVLWQGEDSPLSAAEISAMPTAALVEFLHNWQPPMDRWGSPSRASLRGALSEAVQIDAEHRSADLELFVGLPALYIDAVINGLHQACRNDASFDWARAVKLLEWINKQAREESASLGVDNVFRQWREPRLSMLRLLHAGFNKQPDPVPAEIDEQLWEVIAESCADPDPDTERENAARDEGYGGSFMDLALNTVRPYAIRTAISHGLRVRRRTEQADLSSVFALLDEHLDPAVEPSKSVRSIYGELFPALVWAAPEWAATRVESIFPTASDQQGLLDVAWDAYLSSGRITDSAWNLLKDHYAMMVERLEPVDDDRAEESRAAQIGAHLINRLWHGHLNLDSRGGLLRRYYARLTPKIATHLMWQIGRSLDPATPLDPQVIARLCTLWEFRVSAVKQGADPRELAEFGYWFASGLFEVKWSFAQMLTTLSLAGDMEAEDSVLAKAADLATEHLQASLTVLERWTVQAPNTWRLTQSLDSIRAILRLGVAGNATTRETSRKVVSILLARDHSLDLRDILREEASHPPWPASPPAPHKTR